MQIGLYPYNPQAIPEGYCNVATGFSAILNGDIVDLRWVAPHPSMYYHLVISYTDMGGGVAVDTNVAGQRWVGQLTPNRTYSAVLTTVCDNDPLRTSPTNATVGFATGGHVVQCVPVNVGTVMATMQPEAVTLLWTPVSDATAYKIFYRELNSLLPYEQVSVQAAQVTIQRLVPNTVYEFYIQTLCGSGTVTSDIGTFLTPCDPAVCPPPVIRTVVAGIAAVVAWEYTGLHEGYDLYLNGQLQVANFQSNIFNFSNLAPSTQYNVAVVGRCGDCISVAGTASFTTGVVRCNSVAAVNHSFTSTKVVLAWEAPVGGAASYDVIVNGSLTNVVGLTLEVPLVPGQLYAVTVVARCANGAASDPTGSYFPAPQGCLAIASGSIVKIQRASWILLDWADQPGASSFEWRFRVAAGSWSDWTSTTNSQILVSGLPVSTNYNFEIKVHCANNQVSTVTAINAATTALFAPTDVPEITGLLRRTPNTLRVGFTVGSRLQGNFFLVVDNGSGSQGFAAVGLIAEATGLDPASSYDVWIEDRTPDYEVASSSVTSFDTCPVPQPPASVAAVFNTDGTTTVTFDTDSENYTYAIYQRPLGDINGEWALVEQGNLTSPYTIPPASIYKYMQVRVEARTAICDLGAGVILNPVCPKVTNLVAEITGTTATLSWRGPVGIQYYRVTLRNLIGGHVETDVSEATAVINGLDPRTTYTWSVETICAPDSISFASDPAIFTTQDTSSGAGECSVPEFTAWLQPSEMANPAGGGEVDNSAAGIINYTTLVTDDFDRNLTFNQADGVTPRDITGYTFEAKFYEFGDRSTPILTVGTDTGEMTVGGADGMLNVLIDASVIEGTLGIGLFYYELRWTAPGPVTKLIVKGNFLVKSSV